MRGAQVESDEVILIDEAAPRGEKWRNVSISGFENQYLGSLQEIRDLLKKLK